MDRKRWELAHRLAYKMAGNELAADIYLLHKCDNPRCVNPRHLVPGTQKDNMRGMVQRERHCGKLATKQVRAIRKALSRGATTRALAKKYGVSQPTIWRISNNRTFVEVGHQSGKRPARYGRAPNFDIDARREKMGLAPRHG